MLLLETNHVIKLLKVNSVNFFHRIGVFVQNIPNFYFAESFEDVNFHQLALVSRIKLDLKLQSIRRFSSKSFLFSIGILFDIVSNRQKNTRKSQLTCLLTYWHVDLCPLISLGATLYYRRSSVHAPLVRSGQTCYAHIGMLRLGIKINFTTATFIHQYNGWFHSVHWMPFYLLHSVQKYSTPRYNGTVNVEIRLMLLSNWTFLFHCVKLTLLHLQWLNSAEMKIIWKSSPAKLLHKSSEGSAPSTTN